MPAQIPIDRKRIAEFCPANHIRKLALFGSVLRDDFGPDSDIDVLVEFEPGQKVGFFRLAALQREFSNLLKGREVQLCTAAMLSRFFRDEVVAAAEIQYAA